MTSRLPADSWPLAYFLTFTLYGHWLHGDERESVDRSHGVFDAPRVSANVLRQQYEQDRLSTPAPLLTPEMRAAVTAAITEVCDVRGWLLHTVNVRTNHAHVVASGQVEPETMVTTFKAYATRALRQRGLIAGQQRMWTRHGSTKYVWTERDLQNVWAYVTNGQDEPEFPPGARTEPRA